MSLFEVKLKEPDFSKGEIRWAAKFWWTNKEDDFAEKQFKRFARDLFVILDEDGKPIKPRFETIRIGTTHGYYWSGTRTFLVIGAASTQKEVEEWCIMVATKELSGETSKTPLQYSYYKCWEMSENWPD